VFQTAVVQKRRRDQQSHETGGHGQPRVRTGPATAQLAVEIPVQQARGAGPQVQPERVARLDDQPDVQFGRHFQQSRQDQTVRFEKIRPGHKVSIRAYDIYFIFNVALKKKITTIGPLRL